MVYRDTNFRISLSLFGWKVNILYKEHVAPCICGRVTVYCENMDIMCTHFQKGLFQLPRVVVYPVLKCVGIVLVSLHIARWI